VVAAPRKHDTDLILDAARSLVLEEGPRAASVAAIAAESGAPVGTLYHRFGSRDALLAAAWLRALQRFQERSLGAARGPGDAVEAGVGMARAAIAFAADLPEDAQLLLSLRRDDLLDASPGEGFRIRLGEINAPLEDEIRRLARALTGGDGRRGLDAVMRAIVDLPYAAIRRHGRDGSLPAWLGDDVEAAARTLLRALDRRGHG